jgi:hypothetical protein
VLGLGFIFALQYLISEPAFGPPPLLPSNVFILGNRFLTTTSFVRNQQCGCGPINFAYSCCAVSLASLLD